MSTTIRFNLKTVPGLNARECHRVRAKRVKAERQTTASALSSSFSMGFGANTTCVLLTRHAKRCDDDNLQGALKAVRDEVAHCLGVDDGDARVQYCYAQQPLAKGETAGVSITFGHVTELAKAKALLQRWHDHCGPSVHPETDLVVETRKMLELK